jgi:catechol 2,3-dioxygenase-like lactoylglutathione lyase family enzyme
MLYNMNIKAFVPTTKPEQAKLFYRDILGLKLLTEDNYALEFEANGILLRVAIVNELTPQAFTILGWNVPDIAAIIEALNEQGIICEKYSFFEQDDLGIWISPSGAKVAWFKDPDGNVLSLTQI